MVPVRRRRPFAAAALRERAPRRGGRTGIATFLLLMLLAANLAALFALALAALLK